MSSPKPNGHTKRRKLQSSKQARANWFYTQRDVQDIYQVCPNTVRNWRRNGLKSIKANLLLFLGRDLNEFHKERRRKAKQPVGDYEVFCLSCKDKHSLRDEPFEIANKGRLRTKVILLCPVTGKAASKFVDKTLLDELRQLLKRKSTSETPI
jgi:hypothetical protein